MENEMESTSELRKDIWRLKREILILIVWNCVLDYNIVLLTHRLNNISDCLDLIIDNFDLLLQFGEKIVLKFKQIDEFLKLIPKGIFEKEVSSRVFRLIATMR